MSRQRSRQKIRDADELAIRHAASAVTAQISIATCGLVVLIVTIVIVTVIVQSQPRELAEKATPGEDKIYVDATAVLIAVAVIGVGAIVFAALVSWLIARRAVRPLGQALQLQRAFVADASHELRTPLAVLDARLQLLAHRMAADDPNSVAVANLRADTRALVDMVNELLAAAGGDEGDPSDAVSDASDVVAAAVADLRLLAGERGVTIDLESEPELRVRMPASSFRRCVVALVDNAVAHTPDGGSITVGLARNRTGRTVALTVTDRGPGIRGIDPSRIFDRFAHSDPAPSADDPVGAELPRRRGFGIGLALVRDVAARSGGSVRVESTGAEGTVIVLDAPLQ